MSTVAAEVKRLAEKDVGTQPWALELAKTARNASAGDLGTLVVARAALTKAIADREVELSRARAARKRLRAAELRTRRDARLGRLWEQLFGRTLLGGVYSAFVAWAMIFRAESWSAFRAGFPSIFGFCILAVVASCAFDWFAFSRGEALPHRDPAGKVRKISVATGVVIGVSPVVRIVATQGLDQSIHWGAMLHVGPFEVYQCWASLPIALTVSWIIGGAVSLAVGTSPRRVSRSFFKAQKELRFFAWVGPVGSASYAILISVPQVAGWLFRTFGSPEIIPQWNPLDLWSHSALVIAIGVLAFVLHDCADYLAARSVPLGVAACVSGPLLGLLCLLINPGHILTWCLDAGLRSFHG